MLANKINVHNNYKVLDSDKKHNNIVDEQHLAQINFKK